jgi:hypothetical protein
VARPILLNSCARAATSAETRFRIDYPLAAARATRVVALDDDAKEVVQQAAAQPWAQARFYSVVATGQGLVTMDGEASPLSVELEGVDTLVMVASAGDNTEAAATIGEACLMRGVMTAGLVLSHGDVNSDALLALRPYARILLVPAEPDDLVELLLAMRA